jgi:hypothetical protein
MSGIKPFFITGANAKIKLNDKTLAFCTDISYSIQVLTQTPKILGMYEGSSVEPLGYSVSGSFTIIRYAKDAKANIGGKAPNGVAANDAGNGSGNWGGTWGGNASDFFARNGIGKDGRANEALDPSKFANGVTFDIEIYQKTPPQAGDSQSVVDIAGRAAQNALSVLGGGNNLSGSGVGNAIGVAKIRNCRITQADFQMTKKGAATQRFNFIALYVDEDSFVADFSGKGQQFQG